MMTAWDEYGPLRDDKDGAAPLPDGPLDLIAYQLLSRRVGAELARRGIRERSWTRYRMASTILAEVQSGETWTERRRRTMVGEIGCRHWRQRIGPVYDDTLNALNSPRDTGTIVHAGPRMDAHPAKDGQPTPERDDESLAA